MQGGVAQRADAKSHIGAVFDQVGDAFVAVQLQRDLRVRGAVAVHQRHDHVQHEGRGRIHPQPAGRLLAPGGHLLLGLVHSGQDLPRLGQEDLAFLGQLQAAGGPAQQGGGELLFQPAQAAADAGDCLPQPLGRGGDGAAIHHRGKGLEFVEGGLHS